MKKLCLASAVATLAAVTTTAPADETWLQIKPAASSTKTGTSGHTGTEVKLGDGKSFLYSFEWSERSDDPCWFRVMAASREKGKNWVPATPEHHIGSCTKNESSRKLVYLQSPQTGANDPRFIRSVRVCTSEKKASYQEKLKGIRIKAARFDAATNKFVEENAVEEAYRTNCKTWEQEVSCPAGTAATALYLDYGQVSNGTDAYNGLALQCAAPEAQPSIKISGPAKAPGL